MEQAIWNSIKRQAKLELDLIAKALQQLKIVEVENIQLVLMNYQQGARVAAQNVKSGKGQKEKQELATLVKRGKASKRGKDALVFPYEGEVWFDEIGHYKVNKMSTCKYGDEKA